MRILITGKGGKAGSWAIRAEQLGKASGATVLPMATEDAIRAHDIAVVVKRTPPVLIRRIKAAGLPWVYDVVDPWPQPIGNRWTASEARQWLQSHIASLQPTACLYSSPQQQADAAWPGIVLYHHARPDQPRNPIRATIRTIGYEGRQDYISRIIDSLAPKLPAVEWVINPASLGDVDVVLAMRAGQWDGYAPRHWKSNVKLANAQATGTPIICAPESAYRETASGAECWADCTADALAAIKMIALHGVRAEISQRLRQHARRFSLPWIATQYREYLRSLR